MACSQSITWRGERPPGSRLATPGANAGSGASMSMEM
jgi:hypothetical protein